MVTSEYMVRKYSISAVDPRDWAPGRKRHRFSWRRHHHTRRRKYGELTTAASLWAVSCVRIAVRSGFYAGAAIATIFIFLTLIILKKAEMRFPSRSKHREIVVESENINGQAARVSDLLERCGIEIRSMQLSKGKDDSLTIKLLVKLPDGAADTQVLNDLQLVEGVRKVYRE